MKKLDCMGIKDYYQRLPRGLKDSFAREVADVIGQSTQSAQRKMNNARMSKLEVEAVQKLIERKEA